MSIGVSVFMILELIAAAVVIYMMATKEDKIKAWEDRKIRELRRNICARLLAKDRLTVVPMDEDKPADNDFDLIAFLNSEVGADGR